ncbi:MAG: hypothetical protein LC781_20950 [Actinobacteria bacterium]|nr:hypothetical protein [Actinomycetota bacterium]
MMSGTCCEALQAGAATTAPLGNRRYVEQKRIGWEMAVRIEKIVATVLDEAHKRQVEKVMDTLREGPEGLYKRPPY